MLTCDLFCTVIDNYGDIGVCWRLARQLAHERGWGVRLWVDDLASFARIAPGLDVTAEQQDYQGIAVRHWQSDFPEVTPGQVVIEAFACNLPERFIAAMAQCQPAPQWFNLEYLSAESWVDGCHGLPSPHASLPLVKHFFFPGFTPRSGGLLLERDLFARRDAFQADPEAQNALWHSLNIPPKQADELRIFLFSYPNPAISALWDVCSQGPQPISVLLPEGSAAARLAPSYCASTAPAQAGACFSRGALRLYILPFVEQSAFDPLLWACDINFIRGEDSFVRAQWAARPFIWHIYPQDENAHHEKLAAFLARYTPHWPADTRHTLNALWDVWNGQPSALPLATLWPSFLQHIPEIQAQNDAWAQSQAEHGNLVEKLEKFLPAQL